MSDCPVCKFASTNVSWEAIFGDTIEKITCWNCGKDPRRFLEIAGEDAPDGIRTRGTFPPENPDFQEKS